MSTSTVDAPTIRLGSHRYPVVLPRLRDSRMHIAAVTITLHVLGQTVLGFRVSVPQILAAIVAPALIEFVRTFRRTGSFVWPASAMLTGSGVALIFRVVGTTAGDHWTWYGWHLFAIVGAGSLVTKYVITHRGSHVFNPSNLGLVVAFLVLGSERVEPLDFWWAPLSIAMITAYLVIVAGGIAITARLGLLAMGIAFWLAFAGGLGLLAASGHCMTAAWAAQPVCGSTFWWKLVTSPEVAIFLFFMITDPKTVPVDRRARMIFGIAVAIASVLLIAPQTTEFGAKVGLLAGLTILSPLRYGLDRRVSAGRMAIGRTISREGVPFGVPALLARGSVIGVIVVALAAVVLAAGAPARPVAVPAAAVPLVEVDVDPATLPPIDVEPDVETVLTGATPEDVAAMLIENLMVEVEAARRGDQRLLLAADAGLRLADMERSIDLSVSDGIRAGTEYEFESMHLGLMERDGSQQGAAIEVRALGGSAAVIWDAAGDEVERSEESFEGTFILRQGSDGRWLIDDLLVAD